MSASFDAAVRAPQPPAPDAGDREFTLHLGNFEGPFDLLLHLISRRKLNITEVALAQVTDEFLSFITPLYISASEEALALASEFTLTVATLLDLKTARLLPNREPQTSQEFAALEARDLLFARLLQYKAYKEVAGVLAERFGEESTRFARTVALEERFAKALPELVFEVTPQEFAAIAHRALSTPVEDQLPEQVVETGHLREPLTTIALEEQTILHLLEDQQETTYQELVSSTDELEIAVVRFLAMLELYKEQRIDLTQDKPLGKIHLVRSASAPESQEHQQDAPRPPHTAMVRIRVVKEGSYEYLPRPGLQP